MCGSAVCIPRTWETLGSVCAVVQFGHLVLGKPLVLCVQCVNCGVLRIRQASLVEISFITIFVFCAARLGFSFAHELLRLSRRKKKLSGNFQDCLGNVGASVLVGSVQVGSGCTGPSSGSGNFAGPAWERRFRLIDNKGFAPA